MMPKAPESLADRLHRLRTKAGLSGYAVARRAGLSAQVYYRIESGARPNPSWASVQAIARALGVTTDALRD